MIENEMELNAALTDSVWADAAYEMLGEAGDSVSWEAWLVEVYGASLHGQVCEGYVSVDELRGGVSWANALDAEATQYAHGDIDSLEYYDRLEAYARRIAHHAGRAVLKKHASAEKHSAQVSRFHRAMNILGHYEQLKEELEKEYGYYL